MKHYTEMFARQDETKQEEVNVKETTEILDVDIEKEEIVKAIKELKNGKNPGLDGIPSKFYKKVIEKEEMTEIITKLFNSIWKEKK